MTNIPGGPSDEKSDGREEWRFPSLDEILPERGALALAWRYADLHDRFVRLEVSHAALVARFDAAFGGPSS